jgi:hypothetical protein
MLKTIILEPLDLASIDETFAENLKNSLKKICELLDGIKADETMTFTDRDSVYKSYKNLYITHYIISKTFTG